MTRQKRERKEVYLLKQKAVHLLRQSLFQQLNSHLKKENNCVSKKRLAQRGADKKSLLFFLWKKKWHEKKSGSITWNQTLNLPLRDLLPYQFNYKESIGEQIHIHVTRVLQTARISHVKNACLNTASEMVNSELKKLKNSSLPYYQWWAETE